MEELLQPKLDKLQKAGAGAEVISRKRDVEMIYNRSLRVHHHWGSYLTPIGGYNPHHWELYSSYILYKNTLNLLLNLHVGDEAPLQELGAL